MSIYRKTDRDHKKKLIKKLLISPALQVLGSSYFIDYKSRYKVWSALSSM